MLLSDRDIRAELDSGRIGLDPLDLEMVQPSSVDVRLDRFFRLFDNHKYPYIDPSEDQPDLTHLLEVDADQPFILHPGEFVLGSTFELATMSRLALKAKVRSDASAFSPTQLPVSLTLASRDTSLWNSATSRRFPSSCGRG